MSKNPAIRVNGAVARAPAELVARFAEKPTGWVADALGRSGAMDIGIKPLLPPRPFAGTALTVDSWPRDNLTVYAALDRCKPGDVLLIATGDCTSAAVVGDRVVGMARNCGVVAVITDGLMRDQAGLRDIGLPVYARGVSPNSPHKNGPGSVGFPISMGGVPVASGDIVVGDEDGIVVIPVRRIEEALEALELVEQKESGMDAAVGAGSRRPDWLDEVLKEKGIVIVG